MSASEEECPVCKEKITNPSQPSPCCGKVFCQRCLSQSFRFRTHCPYCRSTDYVNDSLVLPSRRRHLRPILQGNFDTLNSRRPVGSSIRKPWQTEITVMDLNPQPQSSTVRTFVCPYCQDDGLDELDLHDHCNDHHANDFRRVVCPVCVATPHGDPQYYSRDFIGHLNLRHCYYMDDITNLHQSDEMNLQCAILASYRQNI